MIDQAHKAKKNFLVVCWCEPENNMVELTIPLSYIHLYRQINRTLLMMKIIIALMLVGAMHLSATTLSQTITLDVRNATIKEVFDEIHRQTKFGVIYNDQKVDVDKKVTISANHMPLGLFLEKVLGDNKMTYRIREKTIFVRSLVSTRSLPPANVGNRPSSPNDGKSAPQVDQQQFSVTGIVSDQNKQPLRGAAVQNLNTRQTVQTTPAGGYNIRANAGDSIQITMMGYERFAFLANSSRNRVDVTLKEGIETIENVVVTALGIQRDERELGYAFSEVDGEDINKAKETNVINSLAGKVPGLIINSTAGGPAGSSRVIIRGNTSITGNNQPLYVIDGIPMDNSNYGQVGTGMYGGSSSVDPGVDMGDAISAINPDDIEKISVLKGPSASALYGSMAAHGVILITTKKGDRARELGIELSSTNSIETQLTRFDDRQYLYGQGRGGLLPADQESAQNSMFVNFGPRLDPGLTFVGFDGEVRSYGLIEDNISNFFRTGSSFNNTLSMTSATDRSNFRFSASDLRYEDIVPNSNIRRNNFTFSGRSKFGEKLNLDVRAMYLNEAVKNRAGLGDSPTNIGHNLNGLVNNIDQSVFADLRTPSGEYIEWGGGQFRLNPYWVLFDMSNQTQKDRLTGAFSANYTVNKWLKILARGSTDITFIDYDRYTPRTTPRFLAGQLNTSDHKYTTNQAEVLATVTQRLSTDIEFTGRVGASINQRMRQGTTGIYTDMAVTDAVSINSYIDRAITEMDIRRQVNSVYGLLTLGYKKFLYLDGTLRTDQSSTLPVGNSVYTYPSLSTSFVFTDAFPVNKSILSFGKLRASFAEVGSDTDPYQLGVYYSLYRYPFDGAQGAFLSNEVLPNPNLLPTRTRSFEVGANLKFFRDRINFDATYYTARSRDQINVVPTPFSSGFQRQIVNAGVIANRGIELLLSGSPIVKENFSWDVSLNAARNINEVLSLADGVPFLALSEARWLNVVVTAMPGEEYGAIIGYDYSRAPDGQHILDPVSLLPVPSAERQVLGKGVFDWTGGVTNRFTYKNFSLNAVMDMKFGADIFSMTNLYSVMRGSSIRTLPGRDEWIASEQGRVSAGMSLAEWQAMGNAGGYVPEGVVMVGTDTDGSPIYEQNTRAVEPSAYWGNISTGNGVVTPFIYKASYVKVREIVFSYSLPASLNKKLRFQNASIGFVARNPFILYRDIPDVDPDSNYNNSNGQGLEYGSLPSRRGWGINLNVKF